MVSDDEYLTYLIENQYLKLTNSTKTKLLSVCNICNKETRLFAFDPCGHMCCLTCSNKLNNKCHICRGKISKFIKLYF